MIVFGEDGVRVEPVVVGSLQVNVGQRYSVLVCAATETHTHSLSPSSKTRQLTQLDSSRGSWAFNALPVTGTKTVTAVLWCIGAA